MIFVIFLKREGKILHKLIRNYLMCVIKKPWNYVIVHCWRIVPRTVFLSKKIRTLKSDRKIKIFLVKNSPIIRAQKKKMFSFSANLICIFNRNIKCWKERITHGKAYNRKSFENRSSFKQLSPNFGEKKNSSAYEKFALLSWRERKFFLNQLAVLSQAWLPIAAWKSNRTNK